MATIFLLSVDRMLAQRIDEAMGGRVSVELVQSIEREALAGPCLIVIDRAAIPPERALSAAIGTVVESAGGRPVVLATQEMEAEPLLRAIRAGVDDVIPRDGEGAEIAAVLARLLNDAAADRGNRGRLTLVLGADRDACAMVATDMAIAASQGSGQRSTLLIDCTLPTSAAATYLDLNVDYGLASAISDMERLDASLLASTVARHGPSGLMLLTFDGGTGAEPAGLTPGDLAALIRLLRGCCSDVVLNAGSLRHGGLLREVVAEATQVELLCDQSIREIEACRRLLDRIGAERERVEAMRLLVWDHLPGVLLDGRRMADALGVGSVLALPTDRARMRNALNAGRPLAMEADGGTYMAAIRRACGVASKAGGIDRLRRAMLKVVSDFEPDAGIWRLGAARPAKLNRGKQTNERAS
ncbi:AAA family ATPase [Sphingobium sp. TKS]|uniref:AAA family ATPase n=1 Tax=Sphingobium sp. TKS TaxID=1315974 RepID=UPI00077058C8|nr:histidine kinase [Sphingobium sp. TKS]AMK25172.1 response regulator receiver protein [Sphingobium sp. TKS]